MNRAVARGIRRGIYLGATGDTSRLTQIRREAEESSAVEIAWMNVGDRLNQSMEKFAKESPADRESSSSER